MTKATLYVKEKNCLWKLLNLSTLTITVLFSVVLSPKISLFVKEGVRLCFEAIIGSVFPFMIISDVVSHTLNFDSPGIFKNLFEKIFRINGHAISVFLLGAICGFPVGVKLAADLYRRSIITKDECERLIGFSSNMGPAFIISGIGAALCGSIKIGLILYAATLASAIISGFLMGIGKTASKSTLCKEVRHFSLSESIKCASGNTVNICGFIIFFSTVCGLLSTVIKNDFAYALILPFFEISNAVKNVSALTFIPRTAKFIIISFSVSFSGLSIYMQAKSFLSKEKISMKAYLKTKLISAAISSLLMATVSSHM